MIDPPGTFRGCGPVTFLREVSSRRQAKWTFLSRSGSSASRHYGDLIFNQPSADYGCNLHIGTRQCLGQPRHVGVTNERGPISRIPCPSGSSLFHRNSGRLPLLSDRPHEKLEWSGGSPLKGPLSILRDTIQQPLIGPHEGRPRRGVPRASQLLWQLRVRHLLVGQPCNGHRQHARQGGCRRHRRWIRPTRPPMHGAVWLNRLPFPAGQTTDSAQRQQPPRETRLRIAMDEQRPPFSTDAVAVAHVLAGPRRPYSSGSPATGQGSVQFGRISYTPPASSSLPSGLSR